MEIHFTKHANEKFQVLARHGVKLSRAEVIKTIKSPDTIDNSRLPLFIAQRKLDRGHVLRVVYKKDDNLMIIITFYPGRKTQYEKK